MSNYYEDNTDNESYVSLDETDDESEMNDFTYQPEEPTLTKYNLVLCQRYDGILHGICEGEINEHYLTLIRLRKFDNNYMNYIRIMYPNNRLNLEIAECLYLTSQHCVSIIKTYWLKLIQRTWKKILRLRKHIIEMRSQPNIIKYREIHGKWPNYCINYPRLRGMLSNLSRTSS